MMAHLGFHVGWLLLLLLLQPAFGWINLHEVYKIVNEIPDVDVHKMVKSAENDIKDVDQVLKKVATGVQDVDTNKVLKEVSNDIKDIPVDTNKLVKEASNDIKNIPLHKIVKEASDNIEDVDQVLKKVATGVQDVDTNKVLKEVSNDIKDIPVDTNKLVKEASNDIKNIPLHKIVKEASDNIEDLTDVILSALEKVDHSGCKCVDYNCGCCLDLKIPSIQLDDTVCVNITYLPKDYGIMVTFSIDGVIYIRKTISARNPPSICFDIPNLKEIASACVEFYDLDISSSNFHGCIRVELELIHVKLVHEDLGCFNIPVKENMT